MSKITQHFKIEAKSYRAASFLLNLFLRHCMINKDHNQNREGSEG